MFTFTQLQEEQRPWVEHNFSGRPAHQPLLGIVEELGELARAADREEREDAYADIAIFACDYCSAKGWDLADIFTRSELYRRERIPGLMRVDARHFMFIQAADLCHSHLKFEQKIRTGEAHDYAARKALSTLLGELYCTAKDDGLELFAVVEKVWAKVKLRDWKKDSKSAGEVAK